MIDYKVVPSTPMSLKWFVSFRYRFTLECITFTFSWWVVSNCNLERNPVIQTDNLRGFPQFLQEKIGIVPKIRPYVRSISYKMN
jgi:hypothetical protein